MTPDRWRELEHLYHAALEHESGQRDAFIAQACASDPDLRRELESLVSHASDENRLDRPAWEGARVGPYEVLEKLGSGGMGEVWKARDTRLGRLVAIKWSRARFTERFEREARTVAALNHPHICTLYDVGPDYLVMEYIEGSPLKGPLPIPRALQYASQILDALDTANRAGIVHRDLKPANILVNDQGVKLLDFGLAHRVARAAPGAGTITLANVMTAEGMVLGTPQYMAPEQVEGREVDARTDIFAFGCVLYEMLAGECAFQGKTPASVAAAILQVEPPSIPAISSAPLSRVLQTCLAKDPDQRWRTAEDVRHALRIAAECTPAVQAPASWLWPAVAAVTAVMLLTGAWYVYRAELRPRESAAPVQFAIPAPPGTVNSGSASSQVATPIVVSPDGGSVAMVEYDATGRSYVWIRRLDSVSPVRIDSTLGTRGVFWSPDSRHIGFSVNRSLKRASVTGGAAQTIADVGGAGSWSQNGIILFSVFSGEIYQVAASGGTPSLVATPDRDQQETSLYSPVLLPDGKHYLCLVRHQNPESDAVYLGELGSSHKTRLVSTQTVAAYAEPGYLMFVQGRSLFAQKLDLKNVRLEGEAIPIVNDVGPSINGDHPLHSFSVSRNGVLAYRKGSFEDRLYWYDRDGTRTPLGGEGGFRGVLISPNGIRASQIVESRFCVRDLSGGNLNCFDLPTTVLGNSGSWSADSRRLLIASRTSGKFEIRELNIESGSTSVIISSAVRMHKPIWSTSGRFIIYGASDPSGTRVFLLNLTGERKPQLLFETRAFPDLSLSPDDHWLAIASNELGRYEIYIAAIDSISNRVQVSTFGGVQPQWRADGREFYYLSPLGKMMAVDFTPGSPPHVGQPKPLFQTNVHPAYYPPLYYPAPNGKRFLVLESEQADGDRPNVLLHWDAKLSAR